MSATGVGQHKETWSPLSGCGEKTAGGGTIKSINLYFDAHPTGKDSQFGQTGLVYYGKYACGYAGYYGPVHPINSDTQRIVPEYPGCDSLRYWLKDGCLAHADVAWSTLVATSTYWEGYEVNLLYGVTLGLEQTSG